MPLGERVARAVERVLMPWYSRDEVKAQLALADKLDELEDRKAIRTEEITRQSIEARIDSEQVRKAYAATAQRLRR